MSNNGGKILFLNYDAETTDHVTKVFSERCDITTADSLSEVAEKAGPDFDVVITGYVVPAVSGDKAISCLRDIQKAFDEATAALGEKRDANKAFLKERQQEQTRILKFLNDHIRQAEKEKAELKQKMQTVVEEADTYRKETSEAEKKAEAALNVKADAQEKTEAALSARAEAEKEAAAALKGKAQAEEETAAALKAKAEAEEKTAAALSAKVEAEEKGEAALNARAEAEARAEAALIEKAETEESVARLRAEDAGRIEKLSNEVKRLNEELENSISIIEQARAEKAGIEEKLAKLQENWQKFVAGE